MKKVSDYVKSFIDDMTYRKVDGPIADIHNSSVPVFRGLFLILVIAVLALIYGLTSLYFLIGVKAILIFFGSIALAISFIYISINFGKP